VSEPDDRTHEELAPVPEDTAETPDTTEREPDEPEARAEPQEPDDPDEESTAPAKELPPEVRALCRSAIEAMLFSSPEPVSTRRLAEPLSGLGIDARGVRRIVRDLVKEYAAARRGFAIEEVAGGFRMATHPEYADYVGQLLGGGGGGRLSQAALETLAVVAYKQPVTRADIEAIRGVQAGPLLRSLLHKGLVRITGRAELIGRPLLYGTTRAFLKHFGLKSLNELPKVEELPKP